MHGHAGRQKPSDGMPLSRPIMCTWRRAGPSSRFCMGYYISWSLTRRIVIPLPIDYFFRSLAEDQKQWRDRHYFFRHRD